MFINCKCTWQEDLFPVPPLFPPDALSSFPPSLPSLPPPLPCSKLLQEGTIPPHPSPVSPLGVGRQLPPSSSRCVRRSRQRERGWDKVRAFPSAALPGAPAQSPELPALGKRWEVRSVLGGDLLALSSGKLARGPAPDPVASAIFWYGGPAPPSSCSQLVLHPHGTGGGLCGIQ